MCLHWFFLLATEYIHIIVLHYSEYLGTHRGLQERRGEGNANSRILNMKTRERNMFAHIDSAAKPCLKSIFPCCIVQTCKIIPLEASIQNYATSIELQRYWINSYSTNDENEKKINEIFSVVKLVIIAGRQLLILIMIYC
jgi:hypothetical protein